MNLHRSLLSLCAVAAVSASSFADEVRPPAQQEGGQTIEARRVAPDSQGTPLRASSITGMPVRNAANDNLGSINDFVVDMPSGKIRYLAVSYGGFLGLGDKLFAVPPSAFRLMHDADRDRHYLVLDVTEDRLKNAPGFDQNNWPDFADATWQKQVDDYYAPSTRDIEGQR